jgi:hypothetical protein
MAKRGRYYDAPTVVKDMPGVTRVPIGICQDEYSGEAEALAATGLLPIEMFPGMPGQNTTSAAWRPRGVKFVSTQTPGYLRVVRRMNGTYRIQLTVDDDEQDRRLAEKRSREAAAEQAAEAVLQQLPARLREYCESAIRASGGRYYVKCWFNNPEWLTERAISPAIAKQVLHGIEVIEQAELARNIELNLKPASMADAKAVLARAMGGRP